MRGYRGRSLSDEGADHRSRTTPIHMFKGLKWQGWEMSKVR